MTLEQIKPEWQRFVVKIEPPALNTRGTPQIRAAKRRLPHAELIGLTGMDYHRVYMRIRRRAKSADRAMLGLCPRCGLKESHKGFKACVVALKQLLAKAA